MSASDAAPASGPGQEYNPGPATEPRQAASVILLRGGDQALELLLVRRTPAARFMGGVWVFPGGAVDVREGQGDDAHRAAAVRELREEAGITPAQVKIRFDTHFFLGELPDGQRARVDGQECVDAGWFEPAAALAAHAAGELALVFPTIKHLQQLSAFASVEQLISHARGREVQPVQPKVLLEGEVARVLLPGEPGY